MTSQDTSLLKQPQTATFPVSFAQGKSAKKIWTLSYSNKSSMNVENTAPALFPFISSGSHYCTQEYSMQSGILKLRIRQIQSFLRQMERYLTSLPTNSLSYELIESSGAGGRITLMMQPGEFLNQSDSFDFCWKKRPKVRLRSGKGTGKK